MGLSDARGGQCGVGEYTGGGGDCEGVLKGGEGVMRDGEMDGEAGWDWMTTDRCRKGGLYGWFREGEDAEKYHGGISTHGCNTITVGAYGGVI